MQQAIEPAAPAAKRPAKLQLELAKLPQSADTDDPLGNFFVQLSKRFAGMTSEGTNEGEANPSGPRRVSFAGPVLEVAEDQYETEEQDEEKQTAENTVDSAVQEKAEVVEQVDPHTQTTPPAERHGIEGAGVLLDGAIGESHADEEPVRESGKAPTLDPDRRRRVARELWQKAYLTTSLIEVRAVVERLQREREEAAAEQAARAARASRLTKVARNGLKGVRSVRRSISSAIDGVIEDAIGFLDGSVPPQPQLQPLPASSIFEGEQSEELLKRLAELRAEKKMAKAAQAFLERKATGPLIA